MLYILENRYKVQLESFYYELEMFIAPFHVSTIIMLYTILIYHKSSGNNTNGTSWGKNFEGIHLSSVTIEQKIISSSIIFNRNL